MEKLEVHGIKYTPQKGLQMEKQLWLVGQQAGRHFCVIFFFQYSEVSCNLDIGTEEATANMTTLFEFCHWSNAQGQQILCQAKETSWNADRAAGQ